MNSVTAPSALALLEALLRQEWALLETPLPWASLVTVADEQRVAPLLCHRLRVAGHWSRLPQPWAAQLLARYQESALRNTLYLTALEEIVAALNRAGSEPILLKGAALAYTIYPHPALRPMGDLDLWVSPHDFTAAAAALTRAGWRPTVAGQWPLIQQEISHHLRLINPSAFPRVVELHRRWMILPASLRDTAAEELVWQSAQPVAIGCARARILAPIDHFIYLAAHLACHAAYQERLIWYADLEALVDRHAAGFDWDALLARAIQLRLLTPLTWVLDALAQRLALPIPWEIRERLRSVTPDPAAAALFAPPSADWQQMRLERAWQMWRGLPGWCARLLLLRELLLPRPSALARLHPQERKLRLLLRYPQRWLGYAAKLARLALAHMPIAGRGQKLW